MTIEIPLTQGYVTRIDDTDRVFTDGRKWHAVARPYKNTVYARTKINGRQVNLHNLLCPDWEEVDHADGDGLNNCRWNLRDGAQFRNNANTGMRSTNTSGYKGVQRVPGAWTATVTVNRKRTYLGTFGSPEEAAYAYDQAAIRHFGEYARTNAMMGLATTEGSGARQYDGTRCVAGHEYTPENTYINPKGKRECRICKKRHHDESRERVLQRKQAPRGRPCPPGCTCGRHRKRRQAA
jgi:hypothetical protein